MNHYYATVARSCGVPDFWLEDATQDMALDAWRDGRDDALSIRRRAIDAARRYGTTRAGITKATVPLTGEGYATADPHDAVIVRLDLRRALTGLSEANRRVLMRVKRSGRPLTGADMAMRTRARRKLRALMAA